MSREEVFEKLEQVFQDVFDDESLHVTDETTAPSRMPTRSFLRTT